MYIFQFHYKDEFDFDKVVVYSGTHDNDTLMGWYNNLDKDSLKDVDYSSMGAFRRTRNITL